MFVHQMTYNIDHALINIYSCRNLYNWGGKLVNVQDRYFHLIMSNLLIDLGHEHQLSQESILDESYTCGLIKSLVVGQDETYVKRLLYDASIELQYISINVLTPVSHMIQFLDPKYFVRAVNKLAKLTHDCNSSFLSVLHSDPFLNRMTNFESWSDGTWFELTSQNLKIVFELDDESPNQDWDVKFKFGQHVDEQYSCIKSSDILVRKR